MLSSGRTALTIAGLDPSGAAGIVADLQTFSSFGVAGMAVVAALTAQDDAAVAGTFQVPHGFCALQLQTLWAHSAPAAVKTGMLGSAETVEVVARAVRGWRDVVLVVDPVFASTSGAPLLDDAGVAALRDTLMPLAELITPNIAEAEVLTGMNVEDVGGMERAARRLHERGARHVLVKGGHLRGEPVDVFFDGVSIAHFGGPRLAARARGTGCRLSAAITAERCRGVALDRAIRSAREFLRDYLQGQSGKG